MVNEAKQATLIERLQSVPADARLIYEHDQFHHQSIPAGALCAEAVTAIALAYAAGQRDMREKAAGVCAEIRHPWGWSAETQDWVGATEHCATAIRALPIEGEKT